MIQDSWDIKSKDNEVKFAVGKVEHNDEWMQERYVTVTVESPVPINFQIGDYLIYRDERFEINYDPGKIKSAPRFEKGDAFKYENVKFNSLADELTRCDFLDVVLGDNQLHYTGLPKFPFYGGVMQLAERIQANLDRAYGKDVWCVVVDTEFSSDTELNVSVDTIKVSGALEILVNQFKTYYTIKGRTLTIGAAGVPADHLFKYGPGQGLYEIEENAEADQQIVTRLRAYGSTRNIPHRYYNSLTDADGVKLIPDNMAVQHLMLPEFPYTTQDPYIDSQNIDALGVREDTIFFDGSGELEEIYPSIEGMTAEQLKAAGVSCNATGALDVLVSAEQMTDNGVGKIEGDAFAGNATTTAEPATFKVAIKDVGFDINDHLIEGNSEKPTVSFKTGMLGGRDFEIVKCTPQKIDNKTVGYELELNRVYDEDIKLWFPYKDYNAKADDKFVLLNIRMPEVYIKAASQRLKEAAKKWLEKNDYSRSIYNPKIDEIFMARQHDAAMASGGTIKSLHDTLTAGMQLLFEDEDLGIDAAIFIDRLTIIEGEGQIPTYEVVLKEEKTVGRLDKMQNQIDSLAAGQGQGSGGYTASQIRALINVYGGTLFLSKLKDDRSAGKIASDKGFEVGDYMTGVSGAMVGMDAETGKTFAEVDYLYARVKAYFETLTIINAETLAGKQYITPGGGIKCVKVEEVKNAQGSLTGWKCYFLSEQDGEKTETKMIAGDQAISEMFNARTGTSNKVSNHRYWRLVTAVDNDAYTDESGNHYGYIELSGTDCEANSDIPKEGDVIDQLGNRTDATRQAAMVFSTVDADAPSIKMFSGIGSGSTLAEHYSLNDKAIISFGRDPLTNQVYFRLGSSTAEQYLEYSQSDGLELSGRLSILSTIGDKNIIEYFGDIVKDETDKYRYLADSFKNAADGSTHISGGVILSTLMALGYTENEVYHILSGMNGAYNRELGGRTPAAWYGGSMIDRFDINNRRIIPVPENAAASMMRMDGSMYLGGGAHAFNADGSGWLGGENMITFSNGSMVFGSGIKIDLSTGEKGLKETIETFANMLTYFIPVKADGSPAKWSDGSNVIDGIKVLKGFYSDEWISARGRNPSGGTGSGSSGVSKLRLLDDVQLGSDLASGQSLVYNGSKWVNQKIGGFDEEFLSAYLLDKNYATQSWVEGRGYLTGITKQMVEGVLTGNISSHTHSQYLTGITKAMVEAVLTGEITSHTHPYSSLILKINGGTQGSYNPGNADTATFEIKDMASLAVQNSHVGNNGIHVTATERTLWNQTATNLASILGSDADNVINKWDEIVAFLDTYTEADTLANLLSNKADTSLLNNYLPLSGGTLTGRLIIKDPTDNQIALYAPRSKYQYISFFNTDNTRYGYLGTLGSDTLVWNGKTLWHEGNDGSGSGLDADLLDGKHDGEVTAKCLRDPDYHSYPSGRRASANINFANDCGLHYFLATSSMTEGKPSGDGHIIHAEWDNSLSWASQIALPTTSGANIEFRQQNGTTWEAWKKLAFLTDNVASATKLQTSRKIWGQDFDGSGDIIGDLSRVGSIKMNAYLYLTHVLSGEKGQYLVATEDGSIHLSSHNNFAYSRLNVRINYDGKVGINMDSPAYQLDVNGDLRVATRIGFTNGKEIAFLNDRFCFGTANQIAANGVNVGSLLVSNLWADHSKVPTNGIFSKGSVNTEKAFMWAKDSTASWNNGLGALSVRIANNAAQTPLVLGYRAGEEPILGASRVFAMELLNTGTHLRFSFGGAMKFQMESNGRFECTSIKLGDCVITYENGGLKFSTGIWSEGYVSARGQNSNATGGTSSGGTAISNMLKDWAAYDSTKKYYALSAELGWDLYQNKLSQTVADTLYQPKGSYLTALPARLSQYITTDLSDGNGFGRIGSNSPFKAINSASNDCMLVTTGYSDIWRGELALDYRTNNMAYRNKNNGTWNDWALVLTNKNISSYAITSHQSLANYVTLDGAQTISGMKTFSGNLISSTGFIYGETPSTTCPRSHAIHLGHPANNHMDFYEYGAIWNFYKSYNGTDTLIASLTETALTAPSFVKSGGTSSQFLKADGSVDGNTYALSSALGNYLPLGGGKLTGILSIDKGASYVNNYNEGIRIHTSGAQSWASILLCGADNMGDSGTSANTWAITTHAGEFGIGRGGNGISTGAARLWCDADNVWRVNGSNTLWHAGNFNPANYLPLTGGTLKNGGEAGPLNIDTDSSVEAGMRFKMSGVSKGWFGHNVSQGTGVYNYACQKWLAIRDNAQAYVAGNLIWNEGNDGTGSGLDADLLDGAHNGSVTAKCLRDPDHHTETTRRTSANLNFSNDAGLHRFLATSSMSTGKPPEDSHMLHFEWDNSLSWAAQMAIGSDSGNVYTRYQHGTEWQSWVKLAKVTDNVASASKLANTRYLWGRSFDGSSDIVGGLDLFGAIFMWKSEGQRSDNGYYASVSSSTGNLSLMAQSNGAWIRNIMIITHDGKVGVGWSAPNYAFDVVGVIHSTTGIFSDGYVSSRGQNTSDVRLKTDIRSFCAKDIINALKPVSFKWNSVARTKFPALDTDDVQFGLIAQDTLPVAKWLVEEDMFGDGYMGIHYDRMIPLLVEGQIEQFTEVEALCIRVKDLERKIEELEKKNINF